MTNLINEAKAKLNSLSPQGWRDLADELQGNPDYKSFQTEKNVHLVLNSLGISLPKTTGTARKLLDARHSNSTSADILYALSTNQREWFDRLIQAFETRRGERIS